jgi:hypothetical protein
MLLPLPSPNAWCWNADTPTDGRGLPLPAKAKAGSLFGTRIFCRVMIGRPCYDPFRRHTGYSLEQSKCGSLVDSFWRWNILPSLLFWDSFVAFNLTAVMLIPRLSSFLPPRSSYMSSTRPSDGRGLEGPVASLKYPWDSSGLLILSDYQAGLASLHCHGRERVGRTTNSPNFLFDSWSVEATCSSKWLYLGYTLRDEEEWRSFFLHVASLLELVP